MFRQFAPAPCSPPLGGSDGISAVRFTPAVKYGGRENMLFCRETSCMRSRPCRAHHKLKWARKVLSVLGVLYSHLPRSESNKAICAANSVARQRFAVHPSSARSTLFDRGWQQPLNCHKAQPARRVKDAEGTAKPLVLDSVRWLGYLPGEYIRTFHVQKAVPSLHAILLSWHPFSPNSTIVSPRCLHHNKVLTLHIAVHPI